LDWFSQTDQRDTHFGNLRRLARQKKYAKQTAVLVLRACVDVCGGDEV
jgi:hypothetical protein